MNLQTIASPETIPFMRLQKIYSQVVDFLIPVQCLALL